MSAGALAKHYSSFPDSDEKSRRMLDDISRRILSEINNRQATPIVRNIPIPAVEDPKTPASRSILDSRDALPPPPIDVTDNGPVLLAKLFKFYKRAAMPTPMVSAISSWKAGIEKQALASQPLQDDLKYIREHTYLTSLDLGKLLGVTTQAIQDWLGGEAIDPQHAMPMKELKSLVNGCLEKGITLMPHDLRIEVYDDRSMLAMIKSGHSIRSLAGDLISCLIEIENAQARMEKTLENSPAPKLTIEDFGLPHCREDS